MKGDGGARGLGRYLLEARIARGGMGEVFRAAAIGVDGFRKPVVIKRVLAHAASKELSDMFVAEAKLMTRLAHPNIVEVFDFGKSDDGAYYLVMELVDGLDLRGFADGYRPAPMPIALALYVVREALRGLSFAHTQALGADKLVHRDVSPGNILLSALGEVKLADFGVALVATPDDAAGDSLIVGKPTYMAPEQAAGEVVDARADLFSLGVVLYELVTGRLPFSEDAFARRRRGAAATPRDLLTDRGDAPPALAAFVRTALESNPNARFADARAMLRSLDGLRGEGVHPATADDLADAVSERQRTRPPEQVIVIGRDIAGERTRVERGEGGTSFTLSLAEPEAGHHTERLTDDEPLPRQSDPAPLVPSPPRRRSFGRWLAAAGVAAGAVVAFVATRPHAPANSPVRNAPSATNDPAVDLATSLTAKIDEPRRASDSAPPAGTATAAAVPAWPRAGGPPQATASTTAPPLVGCTGTIKIMASHGWAVRGGPTAAEAPGVYSWRCGSYNLSAASRLDDQKRAASVVIQDGKQAIVDLR